MRFAFYNEEIRTICEDANHAEQVFGNKVALALQTRLADLNAASCIGDLIIKGEPREVTGEQESYVIELIMNAKLILTHNKNRVEKNEKGKILWDKVNYVLILEITNPYESD